MAKYIGREVIGLVTQCIQSFLQRCGMCRKISVTIQICIFAWVLLVAYIKRRWRGLSRARKERKTHQSVSGTRYVRTLSPCSWEPHAHDFHGDGSRLQRRVACWPFAVILSLEGLNALVESFKISLHISCLAYLTRTSRRQGDGGRKSS